MTSTQQTGKQGEIEITVDVESTDATHLVTITSGTKQDHYWVWAIPSDMGTACTFLKIGTSERHEVNLDTHHGLHECDCKGFYRYGRCRHTAAAIILHDAGLLKKAPRPEHAAELPAKAPCCSQCGRQIPAGWDGCPDCDYI